MRDFLCGLQVDEADGVGKILFSGIFSGIYIDDHHSLRAFYYKISAGL